MVTRTAGCNMVISGWVCSTVEDFHFFRKKLGSPKKDEHDQNHGISEGRAFKNIELINDCGINCLISHRQHRSYCHNETI